MACSNFDEDPLTKTCYGLQPAHCSCVCLITHGVMLPYGHIIWASEHDLRCAGGAVVPAQRGDGEHARELPHRPHPQCAHPLRRPAPQEPYPALLRRLRRAAARLAPDQGAGHVPLHLRIHRQGGCTPQGPCCPCGRLMRGCQELPADACPRAAESRRGHVLQASSSATACAPTLPLPAEQVRNA